MSYRSEEREGAAKYLHGLLLGIPRKAIEPKVLGLDGTNPEGVRVSCQIGVEVGYASCRLPILSDDGLYIPQEWEEDEVYAAAKVDLRTCRRDTW